MKIRLPWMSTADRRLWRSADSLQDLGDRVALWLTGAIASQAGYQPRYGPDPETAHLVPVLARLNRAGYVTDCSSPASRTPTTTARAGASAPPSPASATTTSCCAASPSPPATPASGPSRTP